MNARELLHVWASQSKAKGKCGNVFFEGASIYSYGLHFEMARITRGASVPVIEARKLYHALAASPDVAGMRVGHYTVTGVRGTDLIVGCHIIPLREVARMAVALGFTKEVA